MATKKGFLSFPLKIIFWFSILSSKMSINMCELRHKVCNGQIYPLEVQISSISEHFFQIKMLLLILGFQKHIALIRL